MPTIPRMTFDGINRTFQDIEDFVVFSQEPQWSKCSELFPHKPKRIIMVEELESGTLQNYASGAGKAEYMVGVGGGTSVDVAKFAAMANDTKAITVPTVVSVNAYLVWTAAVRRKDKVEYYGYKLPELVVIDYSVIKSAPPRLNRAGVGDIYCAKISIMDWKLAHDRLKEDFDPDIANSAEGTVRRLRESAADIKNVTNEGVRAIIRGHCESRTLHHFKDNRPWPERGIEHVFFHTLDRLTKRHFVHGEVVGTGEVLGAYMQDADVDAVVKDLDSFGLKFRPIDLDISREDFERAVQGMRENALASNEDFYVVLNEFKFTRERLNEIWKILS